jgi:hypothetical protein
LSDTVLLQAFEAVLICVTWCSGCARRGVGAMDHSFGAMVARRDRACRSGGDVIDAADAEDARPGLRR